MTSSGITDFGGERLVGVGDPTNDDHAATKKYVDDNSGGGGGGSSAAISDVLYYKSTTPFVLNTGNGWDYGMTAADFGDPDYSRGSDITIEDSGGGAAQFRTAAGGDFGLVVYAQGHLTTVDGGSPDTRFLSAFVVQGADANSEGMDGSLPLVEGQDVYATYAAQPFWGVPAGGVICGDPFGAFMVNSVGTDAITVTLYVSLWKMGPLPT